jgi:hypothetical protein
MNEKRKRRMTGSRTDESCLLYYIMSIATVFLLLTLLSCSPAHVQGRAQMPPVKTAEEFILAMKERLNLNAEQMEEVRPVIEEDRKMRNTIIGKYAGQGREAMSQARYEMEELRRMTESRLSKILTPQQMEDYRKLCDEEARSMRRGRGDGSGVGSRMPRF